jgi:hypothetical protein
VVVDHPESVGSYGDGRAVIEAVRPWNPEVSFLALSVSDAAEDVIA